MPHPLDNIDQTNPRIALWDNVKCLMITFMVIGHFADVFTHISDTCKSIYLFIYAFHMPLFIFISGMFYRDNNNIRKIFYYASCGFALKFTLSFISIILYKSTSFSLLSDAGIPWFMFSLAIFQAIMYLIKKIDKKYILIFSITLACFLGYDQSISDLLYLSRTVVFFPFFLIGTMVTQQTILDFIHKHFKILFLVSILVLALWFYLCFFQLNHFYIYRHLFTGRNPFSEEVIKYGPIARLFCYLITFMTGASLLIIIPKSKIPIFTSLGAHTLNVYFWHWPIYMVLDKYLNINHLFELSFGGKICFMLLAVFLSFIIMFIKYFEYPLKIIRKVCFNDKPCSG